MTRVIKILFVLMILPCMTMASGLIPYSMTKAVGDTKYINVKNDWGCFELNADGDVVMKQTPIRDAWFEVNANGDICPSPYFFKLDSNGDLVLYQ